MSLEPQLEHGGPVGTSRDRGWVHPPAELSETGKHQTPSLASTPAPACIRDSVLRPSHSPAGLVPKLSPLPVASLPGCPPRHSCRDWSFSIASSEHPSPSLSCHQSRLISNLPASLHLHGHGPRPPPLAPESGDSPHHCPHCHLAPMEVPQGPHSPGFLPSLSTQWLPVTSL